MLALFAYFLLSFLNKHDRIQSIKVEVQRMNTIELKDLYYADYQLFNVTPHYHFWNTSGRWSTPEEGRSASGLMYLIGCEAFYYKKNQLFLHAQPGDIIYLPKNSIYTCVFSRTDGSTENAEPQQNPSPLHYNAINIRFDLLHPSNECFTLSKELFIIKNFRNAFSHFKALADMGFDAKCVPAKIKIRLYQLLSELSLHQATQNDFHDKFDTIKNVIKKLEDSSLQNLSVQSLTEDSGLSPSRFRALFNEYTGTSPIAYIERLKADRAYALLQSGEMSISEIAYSLGINDPAYFSRFYKKITGRRPTDDLK